jgi:DNA-binding transcriptional LysR family regulator
MEALTSGQADLALGVAESSTDVGIYAKPLGAVNFVYAMAPHHPLASAPEPLKDELIQQHRAIAVADTLTRGGGLTIGLLGGQDVLTVATMQDKLDAQLRGLGSGFVPECMAGAFIDAGRLVVRQVERPQRIVRVNYAWRSVRKSGHGKALAWWLEQLESPTTRAALLERHRGV